MRTPLIISLFALTTSTACGGEPLATPDASGDIASASARPRDGDPVRGRALFAEKGCVVCHAVNGVGGKAGPALDAQTQMDVPDPVEFAARMWRGAPAMVELQSLELGYVIYLEAQEIVDLAAFAADAEEQKKLSLADIDAATAGAFLDEQFWEVEDWDEFLKNGQDGFGEPAPPGGGEGQDEPR